MGELIKTKITARGTGGGTGRKERSSSSGSGASITDILSRWESTLGDLFVTKESFDELFRKVNIGTEENPIWATESRLGLYSESFLSARGANPGATGTGGGTGSGNMLKTWESYDSGKQYYTLAAVLGKDLLDRVVALEGQNYLDDLGIAVTGSGNAVTAVAQSADKKTLTFTKGSTFLTGITKQMVENVLTGNITSHTHSQYLTGITKAIVEGVLTGEITSHTHPYSNLILKINGGTQGSYNPGDANTATFEIKDMASAATLSQHTGNGTIHITATERTLWNNTATNLSAILGADADNVLNKWEEIVAFLDTYTEADTLAGLLSNKADKTVKISAGTGLTGGGTLAADRTLSLATSGVTAGTYTKLTVDTYGRATAGANLTASDIPSLDWSKITTGKPTTLAGFGITDAYTKTEADGRYVNTDGDTMTGLLAAQAGVQIGSTADIGWFSSASRICAGMSNARGVNVGSLLVSNLWADYTKVPTNGVYIKGPLRLGDCTITYDSATGGLKFSTGIYSEEWVSARGANSAGGSGSSGGSVAFNRLDNWVDYNTGKDQYALSAKLGWDLHTNKLNATKAAIEELLTGNITSHTHSQYLTSHQSLANYVDKTSAQEISGHKVFNGTGGSAYGNWNVGLTIKRAGHTSMEISSDGFTIGLGAHGVNKKWYWWMADKYPSNSTGANPQYIMEFNGSLFDFKKEIRATSIKKLNGTSSQFLKADGSVDSTAYLASSSYTASDVLAKIKNVDGSGSGLDADLLDGVHDGEVTAKKLTCVEPDTVGQTVATAKSNLLAAVKGAVFGNVAKIGAGLINNWSNDSVTVPASSAYSVINVAPQYDGDRYGQYLLFHYSTFNPKLIGRNEWGWTAVKTFAFLDDNVASATKLQTARTIWGQSFDGTGNVTGNLTLGAGNAILGKDSVAILKDYNNANVTLSAAKGDLYIGYDYTNNVRFYSGNASGTGTQKAILLANGNVGIGTTAPEYKLDVNGSIRANSQFIRDGYGGASWNNGYGAYNTAITDNTAQTPLLVAYRAGQTPEVTGANRLFALELLNSGSHLRFAFGGAMKFQMTSNGQFEVTSLKLGDCVITYENGGLRFSTGIWSDSYVSARGQNSNATGGTSSGGTVISNMLKSWAEYDSGKKYYALSAELGKWLYDNKLSSDEAATLYQAKGDYVTIGDSQMITGFKKFRGGLGICFNADTSNALGISWLATDGTTVKHSIIGYNVANQIIINPKGSSSAWVDAEGKYSLIVGENHLTYNTKPVLTSANISSYAVDKTTAQAITGLKTFGSVQSGQTDNKSADRLAIAPYGHTGGPWYFSVFDTNTTAHLRIRYTATTNPLLTLTHTGELTVLGKIIKSGGEASEILMADGSVKNFYKTANVTTATADDGTITPLAMNDWTSKTFLKLTGGTMANTNVVTNLNADLLDGVHKNGFNPGFHFGTDTTKSTGYYKVKITNNQAWMLGFKIMAYQGYTLDEIDISGYNYGDNYWYASTASLICSHGNFAKSSINVFFGYDSAWNLWVAIPANSYAGILITDVVNGYAQINRHDLFEVVYEEALTGTVQKTVTAYRHATVNDNVASATKLQTARSLWGRSFDGSADIVGGLDLFGNIFMWKEGAQKSDNGYYWTINDSTGNLQLCTQKNYAWQRNIMIVTQDGKVGVGWSAPNYAFDVVGVIHSTTGIFSDGYVSARGQNTSDARLKTEIRSFNAREILMGLKPKSFRWNGMARSRFKALDTDEIQYGLIAQETLPVAPWLVERDMFGDGYMGIRYDRLIPVLTESAIEQIAETERLRIRVKELERRVEELERDRLNF